MECSICYQEYNQIITIPTVLPCGHTLCRSCLTACPDECPFCRRPLSSYEKIQAPINWMLLQVDKSSLQKLPTYTPYLLESTLYLGSKYEPFLEHRDNSDITTIIITALPPRTMLDALTRDLKFLTDDTYTIKLAHTVSPQGIIPIITSCPIKILELGPIKSLHYFDQRYEPLLTALKKREILIRLEFEVKGYDIYMWSSLFHKRWRRKYPSFVFQDIWPM